MVCRHSKNFSQKSIQRFNRIKTAWISYKSLSALRSNIIMSTSQVESHLLEKIRTCLHKGCSLNLVTGTMKTKKKIGERMRPWRVDDDEVFFLGGGSSEPWVA
jgi:hypothetical protein